MMNWDRSHTKLSLPQFVTIKICKREIGIDLTYLDSLQNSINILRL